MSSKRWAILIGINYYLRDACLQGCVRDVEGMHSFLQSCSTPSDITMLKSQSPYDPSPAPDDFSTRTTPLGEPASWPTLKNIEDAFDRITREAAPGDFVYIHYSGHGTRLRSPVGETGKAAERLALVVLEDSGLGDCYLGGERFRQSIDAMVAKGLIVTIVLDCCFSGSVSRRHKVIGAQVRTVEYSPAIAALTAEYREAIMYTPEAPIRDSRMLGDWLINPNGFTILSSCSPHEKAQELRFPGTQDRNGALTYFLLEALRTLQARSLSLSHEDLYEDLRIRFQKHWPAQTPMRSGNRQLSFFGHLTPLLGQHFFRGYFDDDERCFRLDAGEAHGLYQGDEFELHPLDSLPVGIGETGLTMKGRVTEVRHLTSDIEVESSQMQGDWWEEGWKAKLITSLSPLKVSIRFLEDALAHVHTARSATASSQRYLKLCDSQDAEVSVFNVQVVDSSTYEILDASRQKVRSLPVIPLDRLEYLMRMLQHLAQFRYMEQLENRKPGVLNEESIFMHACVVESETVLRDSSDTPGIYTVKHGSLWRLSITNKSSEVVYIAIFNMTPAWAIENVLSEGGGNAFLVMMPGEELDDLPFEMTVPDHVREQGHMSCQETIKVIASNRPTTFPGMILPDIMTVVQPTRGPASNDSLSAFLDDLTGSRRGDEGGAWTTRNFTVRTEV